MGTFVNLAAVAATSFRSDQLGPLDSVAHPLKPGEYRGEVWRGDEPVGSFRLAIAESGAGDQIEVDLCAVESKASSAASFASGPVDRTPVYAVFHCDGERGGLRVVVRSSSGKEVEFDSRKLQAGDYYIVTPVRPGDWEMRTGKRGGVGTLTVASPKPAREPRASRGGATIKVNGDSFVPDRATITAGDGAAFEVTDKDVAIALTLVEDKPKPGRRAVGVRYPRHRGRDTEARRDNG
ncbi:MAG TPA: hypothetical protein VMS43_09620 [Allosphingosinicella sp.]|nr:hypothetical protein [Allosphingosinicella sp.]